MITKHHRRPLSKGGLNDESNISLVPLNRHQAWHTLFVNKDPDEIVEEINDTWLDPDYKLILVSKDCVCKKLGCAYES